MKKEIIIEIIQTEKTYTRILGKPKTSFSLLKSRETGMLKAISRPIQRMISFCS